MPVKKLPAVLVFSAMLLLLIFGDAAAHAVSDSLALCVTRVIPPLFPYMVLSSVILSMDLAAPLYRRIPTEKWFGLPRSAAPVLLTGFLCGFPVGASGAAQLVRDGKLSRSDAAALCAVSSAASPAFVIGSLGSQWTREYGLILWLTQVAVSLFLAAFVFRGSGVSPSVQTASEKAVPSAVQSLCTAVTSAAQSCIAVTAFVTFFGTAAALLSVLIPPLTPLFSAVLEFSRGASFGAQTGGLYGIILTGASVGFAGVSVLMQTASFLLPEKIPMKPVISAKLVTMTSSAAVSAVYYLIRRPGVSGIPASGSVFMPDSALVVIAVLGLITAAGKTASRLLKHTEIR